jgi:hypothetical protein
MRVPSLALLALLFAAPAAWGQTYTCSGALSGTPGVPNDDSFTTVAGVYTIPANKFRQSITFFNIPTCATGGIYVSGTNTTANATRGSVNITAGTVLLSLPINVVGTGPITVYSAVAGCAITAWEC